MPKSSHSGATHKHSAKTLEAPRPFTPAEPDVRLYVQPDRNAQNPPRHSEAVLNRANKFPLSQHRHRGLWYKKVGKTFYYFGRIADDPDGTAALNQWLNEKENILAGSPRDASESGLELRDLCNAFVYHKKSLLQSGELAPRTFDRYYNSCEFLLEQFGKAQIVERLRPERFGELRVKMAERWGPVALANEIQIIRSLFKFAFESDLIEKPVRFGPFFDKPSARTMRATRTASGPRLFTPAQIKSLLKHASPNMKAMILLGINGALGNTELALLPLGAADLKGGWLDYARAKTAIPRRIPLWTETTKALKAAIKARPSPTSPADKNLLFIGARGENYTGSHKGYRVSQEFEHVLNDAKITGRTFYDLRRTFQTIAEGAKDLSAVQSIMGHAHGSDDMSAIYRQLVDDERLMDAVNYVHKWLFGTTKAK